MDGIVKRVAVAILLLAMLGVAACGDPTSSDGEYGKQFVTATTVNKTAIVIGEWQRVFGRYPPSVLTTPPTFKAGTTTSNGVCEGIEAVYQALLWPGFPIDADWEAAQVANVDQDKASRAINRTGKRDLMELVDAWGNPLVYFHRDEYRKFSETGAAYLTRDLSKVWPRPYTVASGTFVNPDSFQLYSMGPDAEPNTADDIVSWDR